MIAQAKTLEHHSSRRGWISTSVDVEGDGMCRLQQDAAGPGADQVVATALEAS